MTPKTRCTGTVSENNLEDRTFDEAESEAESEAEGEGIT
jgi:hypothetical protein